MESWRTSSLSTLSWLCIWKRNQWDQPLVSNLATTAGYHFKQEGQKTESEHRMIYYWYMIITWAFWAVFIAVVCHLDCFREIWDVWYFGLFALCCCFLSHLFENRIQMPHHAWKHQKTICGAQLLTMQVPES